MSRLLLHSTKPPILQLRIPWANLDKLSFSGSSHLNTWSRNNNSSNANLFSQRKHLFVDRVVIGVQTFSPSSTTTSTTPAHTILSQYNQNYSTQSRRCYHLCSTNLVQVAKSGNSYPSNNNSSNCQPTRRCSNLFHKYQAIMDAPEGVFCGSVDRFNGITVESSKEYVASEYFVEKLKKSLEFWIQNKRRAIWFKIETEHADWVPHLTKQQFDFHHAKNGFLIMCRWLPTEEYANIPAYSHTMVGVGGLVINDQHQVLVVSDRYALIPDSWKLPGGYVEPRENLIDAAIREVQEETGINCAFKTIVSMRHTHGGNFGCSDVYVVVGLTALNKDLTRCEREIARVQWMPITEYLHHPNVHETNRHFMKTYLDYCRRGIQFTCQMGKHQILKKEYCLYFMQMLEEENDDN